MFRIQDEMFLSMYCIEGHFGDNPQATQVTHTHTLKHGGILELGNNMEQEADQTNKAILTSSSSCQDLCKILTAM